MIARCVLWNGPKSNPRAQRTKQEPSSPGAAFGDGGPARSFSIQVGQAAACAAANCALAGFIVCAFIFVATGSVVLVDVNQEVAALGPIACNGGVAH